MKNKTSKSSFPQLEYAVTWLIWKPEPQEYMCNILLLHWLVFDVGVCDNYTWLPIPHTWLNVMGNRMKVVSKLQFKLPYTFVTDLHEIWRFVSRLTDIVSNIVVCKMIHCRFCYYVCFVNASWL